MDPFAVLGIERQYALDLKEVEKRHRALSRVLHPDKYAGSGVSERNSALSNAVEVNEAWRIVRDPVKRAEALFALAGFELGDGKEPKSGQIFLMDMMELRETLEDAKEKKNLAKVRALGEDIEARAVAAEAALGRAFRNVLDPASASTEASVDGSVATASNAAVHRPSEVLAHSAKAALAPHVSKLGELRFYRRFLEEVEAIEERFLQEAG